jgi:hypothetical protein
VSSCATAFRRTVRAAHTVYDHSPQRHRFWISRWCVVTRPWSTQGQIIPPSWWSIAGQQEPTRTLIRAISFARWVVRVSRGNMTVSSSSSSSSSGEWGGSRHPHDRRHHVHCYHHCSVWGVDWQFCTCSPTATAISPPQRRADAKYKRSSSAATSVQGGVRACDACCCALCAPLQSPYRAPSLRNAAGDPAPAPRRVRVAAGRSHIPVPPSAVRR